MANYTVLKQAVADVIKTNGNEEITGALLQNILVTMVSTLGKNRAFAGAVNPAFSPGVEDGNVFYIASQSGVYPNFNGQTVDLKDGITLLTNSVAGVWGKVVIPVEIDTSGLATKGEVLEKANSSDIGLFSYKAGDNIIENYILAPNTDENTFDIGFFYDKRNGSKLAGGDFLASKGIQQIVGGETYNYRFRLYGYAGICFFDKDNNFVQSIAPVSNGSEWTYLEGTIELPENVTGVGYTFPRALIKTDLFFRPTQDLILVSDKVFQPVNTAVLKTEKTEDINPLGDKKKVPTEGAIIKYTPSFDFLGISQVKQGENLVEKYRNVPANDPLLLDNGFFYDKRNGNKLPGGDFACSKNREPIIGGATYDYYFRLYRFAGVCFFDKNGNFVQSIAPASDTDPTWEVLEGTITLDESVTSVGYSFSASIANGRGNALFSPIQDLILVTDKVFQPAGTTPPPPDLSGYYKKNTGIIISLGDSVTEFGTYPQQLGVELGYTGLRCGVGGTRLSTHVLQHYDELSFYQIAEAIATGNFTSVNTALDALIAAAQTPDPGKAARLTQTKNNLNNTNFNDVSIVTVGFGTNDFTGAKPLGEMSLENEDVDTIVGALNYGCRMLLEAFPHLKIVVVTPTHRYIGTSPTWESSDSYANGAGLSLIDYVDTLIAASNLRHMPAKDLYREGWFCKENHITYFSDAVHPRAVGYTQIARILAGFIKSKLF